ncbi:MAG TPA: hypothetical protein IGS40_04520 [Trichormus sp. M33_DOE_039]|nr:hypothetical protein [Trichormus sp. M33_DOE_039]
MCSRSVPEGRSTGSPVALLRRSKLHGETRQFLQVGEADDTCYKSAKPPNAVSPQRSVSSRPRWFTND